MRGLRKVPPHGLHASVVRVSGGCRARPMETTVSWSGSVCPSVGTGAARLSSPAPPEYTRARTPSSQIRNEHP